MHETCYYPLYINAILYYDDKIIICVASTSTDMNLKLYKKD